MTNKMLFNFKKLSFLIIAVTPILILGFFISQTTIVDSLRNLKVIGWMTVIFGIFLFLSDKVEVKKNYSENFNFKDALIIGLIHCFTIIPGVSRSGVSITTCRFLSYDRVNSAKISFLISIPTLFAVSIFATTKNKSKYLKYKIDFQKLFKKFSCSFSANR